MKHQAPSTEEIEEKLPALFLSLLTRWSERVLYIQVERVPLLVWDPEFRKATKNG